MGKALEGRRAPLARTDELVLQALADEVLIYDLRRHKAHCLNRASAFIWNHCDGKTTPVEIALLLEKELSIPVSEDVIWFALNKLSKADLLREPVILPQAKAGMSRRSAIRWLGVGALTIPAVISIVAPRAVGAASIPAACLVCISFLQGGGTCPAACNSSVIGSCMLSDTCGGGANGTNSCPTCQSIGGHSWIAP